MKNKKGFTLIELLAVIIILAVIALIATPIVLNVVDKARKEANRNSVYGLLDGAKLYYTEALLDNSKYTKVNGSTNLINEINISGQKPESGELYINKKGETAIAAVYGNICYTKNFNETDLTESGDVTNCKFGTYTSYVIGNKVKLTSGTDTTSEWYVIEDSSSASATVKLLKATNIDNNTYAFDTPGNRTPENSTLCSKVECSLSIYSKYNGEVSFLFQDITYKGTVTVDSTIKQNVDSYGNSLSLGDNLQEIRLLTDKEFQSIKENEWIIPKQIGYYVMFDGDGLFGTRDGSLVDIYSVDKNAEGGLVYYFTMPKNEEHGIRPVIIVSKSIVK